MTKYIISYELDGKEIELVAKTREEADQTADFLIDVPGGVEVYERY